MRVVDVVENWNGRGINRVDRRLGFVASRSAQRRRGSCTFGPDGHVASLFPGTTALGEGRRWVVAVPSAGIAPFVPRISLTLPCVASTWEILFLVTGHGKQGILSRIFANEDLPANRARPFAGETIWFIDDAAKPVNF